MRMIASAGAPQLRFNSLDTGQHREEFNGKRKKLPRTLRKDAMVEANSHLALPPRIQPFMRGCEHPC